MRKHDLNAVAAILFIGAIFLAPQFADAGVIGRPANNLGLIGYWSFNEGTTTSVGDFSGFGNTGTASTSMWTSGRRGTALNFNGTNQYATMSTFNQSLLPATFVSWVYVPTAADLQACRGVVFSRGTSVSGINVGACSASTKLGYHWNGAANTWGWTGGPPVPIGEWFLAALVVESSQATMYAITASGATSTANGVAHTASTINDLKIGVDETLDRYFEGKIDEARIYNRALTQAELQVLYQSGAAVLNKSHTSVAEGLVGWWTMDGQEMSMNIGDKSGNGNNGYLVNAPTSTAQIVGKIGSALSFDGIDDYVIVNDSDSLDTANGLTVSAWIYDSNDGQQRHSINKDNTSQRNWIIRRQTDTTGNYHMWNSGGTLRQFVPANSWKINEWFHVVFTAAVSGSTINLEVFINGVSVGTDSFAGTALQTGTSRMHMGIDAPGGSEKRQRLDDVRVYNRAVSAAEAKQIYNESAGAKINVSTATGSLNDGLVGYWSFNGPDVTDTAIYDRSPSGVNSYFVNSATSTAKTPGVIGQALNFNGVNNFASLLTDFSEPSNLTLSIWFKTTSTASKNALFGQANVQPPTGASSFVPPLWVLSDGRVRAELWTGGAGQIYSSSGYNDGHWHMATLVATTTMQSLYVDGEYVGSRSGTLSQSWWVSSTIGAAYVNSRESQSGWGYFNGSIDEVRFYNRALSAAEIKRLYNTGQ